MSSALYNKTNIYIV